MILPPAWTFPLTWYLSLPTGVPGGIGLPVWLWITAAVIKVKISKLQLAAIAQNCHLSRISRIYQCKNSFSWGKIFKETYTLVLDYTQIYPKISKYTEIYFQIHPNTPKYTPKKQKYPKYTQLCTQTLTYSVCRNSCAFIG